MASVQRGSTDDPTRSVTDAKHPVSVVAGPYGHPFHPILVTIPIGAWVTAFIFDLVSRRAGEAAVFTKGAYWLIGMGIIGAVLAAVFGVLDLLTIPRASKAFRTGVTHMALNLSAVALFAIGFAARHGHLNDRSGTPISLIVLSAVTLAVLGASGWLGGKLSYRYGVRVADEATQAEGFS